MAYVPAKDREVIVRLLQEEEHVLTSCPHCGANGRYVQHFITAQGERKAAMRGCLKNAFYVHPLATQRRTWEKRLKQYPGWKTAERELARIDSDVARLFPCAATAGVGY